MRMKPSTVPKLWMVMAKASKEQGKKELLEVLKEGVKFKPVFIKIIEDIVKVMITPEKVNLSEKMIEMAELKKSRT